MSRWRARSPSTSETVERVSCVAIAKPSADRRSCIPNRDATPIRPSEPLKQELHCRRNPLALRRERGDRRAEHYRNALRQPFTAPLAWEPVLPAFEAGQLRVIPLTSAEAVWHEAIEMRHCADRYIAQCAQHDAAFFSLQRHTGKRIATMAFIDNVTKWVPLELAGKANSEPTLEVRKVAGLIDERMQRIPIRARPEELKLPLSSAVSFDEGLSFYEVLDREEIMRRSVSSRGSIRSSS